jgi:uncharacterized membrane protein
MGKTLQPQSIDDVLKLEAKERRKASLSDKIADKITTFSGSMLYVFLHIIWFGAWITINLNFVPGVKQFDPFPFSLLTMIVSLEAIILTSFVLISQNKQSHTADKRAKLDLQINILTERENSKMLQLIVDLHHHFKLSKKHTREVKKLEKKTNIDDLLKRLDKSEEQKKS